MSACYFDMLKLKSQATGSITQKVEVCPQIYFEIIKFNRFFSIRVILRDGAKRAQPAELSLNH